MKLKLEGGSLMLQRSYFSTVIRGLPSTLEILAQAHKCYEPY